MMFLNMKEWVVFFGKKILGLCCNLERFVKCHEIASHVFFKKILSIFTRFFFGQFIIFFKFILFKKLCKMATSFLVKQHRSANRESWPGQTNFNFAMEIC